MFFRHNWSKNFLKPFFRKWYIATERAECNTFKHVYSFFSYRRFIFLSLQNHARIFVHKDMRSNFGIVFKTTQTNDSWHAIVKIVGHIVYCEEKLLRISYWIINMQLFHSLIIYLFESTIHSLYFFSREICFFN